VEIFESIMGDFKNRVTIGGRPAQRFHASAEVLRKAPAWAADGNNTAV